MRQAVHDRFVKAGIAPHKETCGPGLAPSLGVQIDGSLELQVIDHRVATLRAATACAAEKLSMTPRQLSALLGSWVWCFTLVKEMISVLSVVYAFISAYPMDEPHLLWESARQELRSLVALSGLMRCPLDQPWSPGVLVVASSERGFGVVQRTAPIERVRQEARLAERKG